MFYIYKLCYDQDATIKVVNIYSIAYLFAFLFVYLCIISI